MPRFVGTLVVVAVIAIVGFLFRDYLKSNAGELRAGDCFDEPAGVTDTIDDVQHHPCTEAHRFEAILVTDHPAAKNAAFPTADALEGWVGAQCVPVFASYTGLDLKTQDAVELWYYTPTAEGWDKGSRKIICYVGRSDGTSVSQSFRAATP